MAPRGIRREGECLVNKTKKGNKFFDGASDNNNKHEIKHFVYTYRTAREYSKNSPHAQKLARNRKRKGRC